MRTLTRSGRAAGGALSNAGMVGDRPRPWGRGHRVGLSFGEEGAIRSGMAAAVPVSGHVYSRATQCDSAPRARRPLTVTPASWRRALPRTGPSEKPRCQAMRSREGIP